MLVKGELLFPFFDSLVFRIIQNPFRKFRVRVRKVKDNEKNISAEEKTASERTRLPQKNENL